MWGEVGVYGGFCEAVGELLLSMILGTSTAHLVLNNLQQALGLLWLSLRVFKVKEKKRTLRKSKKGNI